MVGICIQNNSKRNRLSIIAFLILLPASPVRADNVSVFNWETGQVENYTVTEQGESTTIRKWNGEQVTGRKTSKDKARFFNWNTGEQSEVEKTGPDKYRGFNWSTGESFDYRVNPETDTVDKYNRDTGKSNQYQLMD